MFGTKLYIFIISHIKKVVKSIHLSTTTEPQNEWAALCAAHEMAGQKTESQIVERVKGIEPSSQLWKSWIITIIRHPHIKFDLKQLRSNP